MQRRIVRQRKEYLYRKHQETEARQLHEKKAKLKAAIEGSKSVPTELRKDAGKLRKLIRLDDPDVDINPRSAIDDEYATAGIEDPRILVTTCRDPSSRLMQFAKELRLIFPNAQRVNRGNYVIKELVDDCRSRNITDLVIVHEHRGEPDGLIISHLPFGPTAYFSMSNVIMRHDLPKVGPVSEQYPHLIFEGFSTNLGKRLTTMLKYLFPVPKPDSQRVITFANDDDFVAFRHHVFEQKGNNVALQEVGPRFDLKLFQVKLGTPDMAAAEIEWQLRPFMNTASKRKAL